MITYRVNPFFDSSCYESKLIKDVHYFVCDDTTHGTLYVQHCFMLQWEFLKSEGCIPTHHVVRSDGYSGQFKSSRAWYIVAHYSSQTAGIDCPHDCQMTWNFFATRHKKSEVNGACILEKRGA